MSWRDQSTVTVQGESTKSADRMAPGARVGRFVVSARVGAGAMGVVYRARDPQLGRDVALKVLASDDDGGHGRARMLREAKAIARLDHPHVVSVYDVGAIGDATMYFAMQFVDGQNVAEWLRSESREPAAIIDVFRQAALGLAAAHDAGLVHRDFKPSNVLVDAKGHVRVADFGLARGVDEATVDDGPSNDVGETTLDEGQGLTSTGALVGTPRYMAPEQLDHRPSDARTDQFSYCVAFWEALAGEHPFDPESGLIREAMQRGPGRPPAAIPGRIAGALRRGMSERPRDRFSSMHELLRAMSPPKRRRVAWAITGTLLAAGLGVGVTLWTRPPEPLRVVAPPCISGAKEIQSVWNGPRANQVRESFERAGVASAEAQAERFVTLADERANAWVAAWDGACRATNVDQAQSDEAMDLTQACLVERREELDALLGLAIEESEGSADMQEFSRALATLTPLAWCDDVEALRDSTQLPNDPELRERVLELRAQVQRLQMLTSARADEAPEVYDPIIEQARELGHGPTLARALHEKAVIQQRDKDTSSAEPLFREAISVAAESGDAMLEGLAWVGLARVLAAEEQFNGQRQAQIAIEAARARASRAADPEHLNGLIDIGAANIATFMERDDEKARELLASSLEHFERARGDVQLEIARVERTRSMNFSRLGEHDEAERAALRALSITQDVLGRDHALVASAHYKLMSSAYYQDDFEKALTHAETAYEIRKATGGADDYYTLLMANAVAACLAKLDRHDEAVKWADMAVDGYAKNERDGARMMIIDPLLTRARSHLALGQTEAAVADVHRGLDAAESTLGPKHPLVIDAHALLDEAKG